MATPIRRDVMQFGEFTGTTLVPAIAIPVSLIGTFGVMLATGQTINNLTLFGLVLAIGIVVDDAILVVENTTRLMDEEGLPAKEAVAKAMDEVAGAVVATTLVLLAVFTPTLVMPGLTGRLYRPFAITLSVATVFSSINALTLSPARCGMLLRPTPARRGWFFRRFNGFLGWARGSYMGTVTMLVRRVGVALTAFVVLLGATAAGLLRMPTGFVPDEDEGYFFVNAQLPDSAALERTEAVMDRVNGILTNHPAIEYVASVKGYSPLNATQGPNYAFSVAKLTPWEERKSPELEVHGILGSVQPKLFQVRQAIAFGFTPPPIRGLGAASGFRLEIQDRGGAGLIALEQIANDITAEGNQSPIITRLNQNFRARVPQLFVDVDRTKAKKLGVSLEEVFNTLQANLGSTYANDFNRFGRTWRVMVQADAQYRSRPEDIERLEVRTLEGRMVPLGTLVEVRDTAGPETVNRFNMFRSATITGTTMPGFSDGQAMEEIRRIVKELSPPSIAFEWSGVSQQQVAAGNLAPIIFALALVFVFLFLAAQYETWATPLSVMLTVPVAILGAVTLTFLRSMDNNIYFQVGLVLLIGLASKNAILIVEFAKQLRGQGKPVLEAALEAARIRFRPILMTAFSFILGAIPRVMASGAGAVQSATKRGLE